jgi:hypothetical protein
MAGAKSFRELKVYVAAREAAKRRVNGDR